MIAFDTETTGVDLYHGATPFLVTTCNEAGQNVYWEWDVDPLTRKPIIPREDLDEIRQTIEEAEGLALQNPKFDAGAIATILPDLRWPWHKTEDTLSAGHILASILPHDLTSMTLQYLGVDIEPYEVRMKAAVNEARRVARSKYPTWKIAKEGLPEMPSAKSGSKKDKKGVESESPWKFDCWLPRAIAKEEGYPEDHSWWTITAEYANADSAATLPLWNAMRRLLEQRGLWEIYAKVRRKLPGIIHAMETRGVTVNLDHLDELEGKFREESERANRICVNIAAGYGYELSLPKSGTNNSLRHFLFGTEEKGGKDAAMSLPILKFTDTGGPCLDKEVLERYEIELPPRSKALTFIKNFRGKRKVDTALSYMESYRKYGVPLKGTRSLVLHPSLNSTGTNTLRFSCSNPNEQNISKQEGFNIRYAFGPAPGREWWSLDYENIEMRIPAYESGEQLMIELFEKPDEPPLFGSYHLLNASIIYPDLFWPLAEQKGAFKKKYGATYYQWIKNFGFAVSYGAIPESGTADRAAHKIGAQRMVMDRLKEHTKLNQKYIDFANRHGYVESLPDKTVDPTKGYPVMCSRTEYGKISPTVPLNYHVQSTAMWCTIKAMIRCSEYLDRLNAEDARGYFLVMQVHDEMVFDFPYLPNKGNLPKIKKIKALMEESGADISIPLRVSVSYHPNNWSTE